MNGDEHCCKVCGKCFPCGRSLGGHMRSHLASNSATLEEEQKKQKKKKKKKLLYGLRENPAKTWRLSPTPSSSSSHDKVCRECGKCFPSWNSLFGHMGCHSLKSYCSLDGGEAEEEEEKVSSWSGGGEARARRRIGSCSSSASEFDKEQEDVALCLMMLSRDNGSCGGFNMNVITEFSDKNSIVFEEEEGFEKKKVLVSPTNADSDVSDNNDNGFQKNIQVPDEEASKKKRNRYECQACNKSFTSYQALGGHKASHKRNDFTYLDGVVNDPSMKKKKKTKQQQQQKTKTPSKEIVNLKINNHQCSICGKVFGSGQALGGHKRSHVVVSNEQPSSAMTALLDLNLPAPTHEVSNNATNVNAPWFTGMISN